MKPREYLRLRHGVIEAGYASEIEWAEGLALPASADEFAREFVWVVLNSGMKNQVARQIADRVYPIIEEGDTARCVFGHKAKCAAIDTFWKKRTALYKEYIALTNWSQRFAFADPRHLRTRLGVAPCIGSITRWHLAKNWGVDCAKPDRHLERLAQHYGTTTHDLCAALAKKTGDRVATVDLVIWRAANLGLIKTRELGR